MGDLTKRRYLLAILAMGLFIGDIAWLLLRERNHADFTLELTLQTASANYAGKLITFDPQRRRWRVDSREIVSVAPFLQDDDPERVGVDSIGLSAMVSLGRLARVDDARRALVLLASEGVCQFAFFVGAAPITPGAFEEVTVARLLTVRTDTDEIRRCLDRVNSNRRPLSNVRSPPKADIS